MAIRSLAHTGQSGYFLTEQRGECGMAVYAAAGLTALFYLIMLPVRAGIAWRTGEPLRVGITIGGLRFSAHGGIKYGVGAGLIASLTHDRSGRIHSFNLLQSAAERAARRNRFEAMSRALKYLFRRVQIQQIRSSAHLSLPDASHTAFLYGMLRAAFSTLHAVRPSLPLTASVSADFHSGHTQAAFLGILSCRFGHIMAAAVIFCRDYLARRIHTWTSSQSKAS